MNNLHTVSSILQTLFDNQLWLQDSKPVRELIFNIYIVLVHFYIINLCILSFPCHDASNYFIYVHSALKDRCSLEDVFSMWVTALSGSFPCQQRGTLFDFMLFYLIFYLMMDATAAMQSDCVSALSSNTLSSGVKCCEVIKLLFKQTCTGVSVSPPLPSTVINSPAGSAVSSLQERRSVVLLDVITELIPGYKLFISLMFSHHKP